jgi:raffinose/stachyose/melibiose transport system substrate-binding protein
MDANDGEWRNSFASQGVLNLWGLGDEQYGAPFNFGPVGMWYNKALVEQLGFDPENPYETWDDFVAIVEAANEAGITPISLGEGEKWPGHFWYAYLALRLGGGPAYQAAYDRSGAFTDQPFVDAYQYIADLVGMDAFEEGFLGLGHEDSTAIFERGEAVFMLQGTWSPGYGESVCDCEPLGENRGWTTFPVIEGGAGNPTDVFGGGDGFAVGVNAPDEAIELLKLITSPEVQEIGAGLWTLPTNVGGEAYLAGNPFGAQWLNAMGEATVIVSFLDQFYPPALGEAVNDTVETVFAGAATPEEAAQALEDTAIFELEQ